MHNNKYDLSSAKHCKLPAKGKDIVKTSLDIALPKWIYAEIAPKSTLAIKQFIDVGIVVVDIDYREVGEVLFNHSNNDFVVNQGVHIAKLILKKTPMLEV